MDDSPAIDDPEDMSVVPYDNHREVVLRHANSVVYRDPTSKQLISHGPDSRIGRGQLDECPHCHRPYARDPSTPAAEGPGSFDEQPNFINREYFRMLAQSLPAPPDSPLPPSPRRRLAQPVGTRTTIPRNQIPLDAELIGTSPAPTASQTQGISETAFAPNYFEKFFKIEKELGRGGRGVVLLVKHVLDGVTLGYFACKRVPIGDDHTWLEKVLVEVQLLQTLSHQNLVSYRHVWLEDFQLNTFGPSVPCAFILQQYCNGGDLHNYICGPAQASTTTQELKERIRRRSKGETEMPRSVHEPRMLQFDHIYSFFRDITSGLRFLHMNNFVHRDLKPSNCLLHTTGHEIRVLVSDFGEVQYEYVPRKSTGATGTISYCAPEVLQRVSPDGPYGNFTFKSDIFSLGMILHFLCFANLPYRCADVLHEEREDIEELRAEITSWEGFDDQRKLRPELPAKLYTFLKRLLSINPNDRPTAEEVNYGIRTGGLEELPEIRRRNSSSPDDLAVGPRVQPIDSPMRGKSPKRGSESDQSYPTGSLRQGLRSQLRQRQRSRDTFVDERLNGETYERKRSIADLSLKPLDVSNTRQDVILRPKPLPIPSNHTSPISSPRHSPEVQPRYPPLPNSSSPPPTASSTSTSYYEAVKTDGGDVSPRLMTPLLLPAPPPPPRHRTYLLSFLNYTVPLSPPLRLTLLLLKLLSIIHPCTSISAALNPTTVYPLITLAILEFTLPRRTYTIWKAASALLLHAVIMTWAQRGVGLCLSKEERQWEQSMTA